MDSNENISLIKACLWQLFPNRVSCSVRLLEWNAPPAYMRQCALSIMENLSMNQRTAIQLICIRLHALVNRQDHSDFLFELTAQIAHVLFVKSTGGNTVRQMQQLLSGVRILLILSDIINEISFKISSSDAEYKVLQSLSQALMQEDADCGSNVNPSNEPNELIRTFNGFSGIENSFINITAVEFYIDPLDIFSPYYYGDSRTDQLNNYTNLCHKNDVDEVYTGVRAQTDLSKYYQIAF